MACLNQLYKHRIATDVNIPALPRNTCTGKKQEKEKKRRSRPSADKHPVICPLASISQCQGCLLARFVLYTTAKTLKQGAEPRTKVYPPRFHRGKASNPVSALQVSTAGGQERKEERGKGGEGKKKSKKSSGGTSEASVLSVVCL